MKVILQHSVQKLGKAGDIVEAKPGYFRNYLQPRGIAVVASTGTLKKREEDRKRRFETRVDVAVRTAGAIAMVWLVYWSWLQMTALP